MVYNMYIFIIFQIASMIKAEHWNASRGRQSCGYFYLLLVMRFSNGVARVLQIKIGVKLWCGAGATVKKIMTDWNCSSLEDQQAEDF